MTKTKEKRKAMKAMKALMSKARKMNRAYTKVYEEESKPSQIAAFKALHQSLKTTEEIFEFLDEAKIDLFKFEGLTEKTKVKLKQAQENVSRISKSLASLKLQSV